MNCYINNKGLGGIVEGHVLDVNRKHLERELKRYDSQLYLKWNPLKTVFSNGNVRFAPPEGDYWQGYGEGCWELRRLPNEKTAVPKWEHNGIIYFNLEYQELEIINCIKNFRYLTYDILQWVKEADTWNVKDFGKELEYQEDKSYDKALDENMANLRYAIKHQRRAMRDFQDEIKSGRSPLEFLSGKW